MVPCTEEGPQRPPGLMRAARHCEWPADLLGAWQGAGRGLSLRGRMPMSGKEAEGPCSNPAKAVERGL